ncbi:unnamed protein product, partial [Brassica rapa subsp. narinosa]
VDVRVRERRETGTLDPSLTRSISPASAGTQSKLSPTKKKKKKKKLSPTRLKKQAFYAESEFGVYKYSKNLMMAYLKDLYSKYN